MLPRCILWLLSAMLQYWLQHKYWNLCFFFVVSYVFAKRIRCSSSDASKKKNPEALHLVFYISVKNMAADMVPNILRLVGKTTSRETERREKSLL
jgi:hypothetical protein